MSLQDGVCSLGGYEQAYRACACVCGKGILRRDLRYTSPGRICWPRRQKVRKLEEKVRKEVEKNKNGTTAHLRKEQSNRQLGKPDQSHCQ